MATRTGSASEFVLALLEKQPDRAWRISELHAECAGKWNVDNFHETLKRLLAAGLVKKTVGEGRATWWSALSGAAAAQTSAPSLAPVVTQAPAASSGTASKFIVDLLGKQPELEWRIREIVDASGNKWHEATVYNTLTRLLEAGTVKKALTDRQAWWSIAGDAGTMAPSAPAVATAPPPSVSATAAPLKAAPSAAAAKPAMPPARARLPPQLVKPAEQSTGGAAVFIVDLLTRHPDYEMQVNDLWEEADRKWAAQTISNTLERLVKQGHVQRVKDGRHVWYSIAA